MNKITFNKFKLRNLRISADLTTYQLGKLIGVSHQAITLWENGKSQPSTINVTKLAKIFNVTTDYLFNMTDSPNAIDPSNDSIIADNRHKQISKLSDLSNKLDEKNLDTLCKIAKILVDNNQ